MADWSGGWNIVTYTGVTASSLSWDGNGKPVFGTMDKACEVRTLVQIVNNVVEVFGFDMQAIGLYSGRLRMLSYMNPVQFINAHITPTTTSDDDPFTSEVETTNKILSEIPAQDLGSLSDSSHTLRFSGGIKTPTAIRTDFTENSNRRQLSTFCKINDVAIRAVSDPYLF